MPGPCAPPSRQARTELASWLQAQQDMTLLRLITCGSVDDGKSTLIFRVLATLVILRTICSNNSVVERINS